MNNRHLVIDTATPACSVALFEGEALIASEYHEIGRGHAEFLIPLIASLPDKGRANTISVNCGPGSFTGVRIGISAAKALALAWQAKLSGYQSLHLMAAQALSELAEEAPVFVAMPGGHGELFVQNFNADGTAADNLESLPPEAAGKKCNAMHIVGPGAPALGVEAPAIYPDAKHILLLGSAGYLNDIRPVYGREPDAKPNNASA